MYGEELAKWLFENLPKHGLKPQDYFGEDWGWMVVKSVPGDVDGTLIRGAIWGQRTARTTAGNCCQAVESVWRSF